MTASCNGQALSPTLDIPAGATGVHSQTYPGIPAGSVCSATAGPDGGTSTVQVTITGDGRSVSIPAGGVGTVAHHGHVHVTPGFVDSDQDHRRPRRWPARMRSLSRRSATGPRSRPSSPSPPGRPQAPTHRPMAQYRPARRARCMRSQTARQHCVGDDNRRGPNRDCTGSPRRRGRHHRYLRSSPRLVESRQDNRRPRRRPAGSGHRPGGLQRVSALADAQRPGRGGRRHVLAYVPPHNRRLGLSR